MAIMARWRKPPESWCGYCRARTAGSGTAARSSAASDAAVDFLARDARLVRANRFGDLRAHAHHGIQRRHRLLKNHGDVAAAHGDLFAFAEREQIDARSGGAVRCPERKPRFAAHFRSRRQAVPSAPAPAWISRCPIHRPGPATRPFPARTKRRPPDESIPRAWEFRR